MTPVIHTLTLGFQVSYYGQAVALVLADTQRHADEAAQLVQVTYANVQTPLITWQDAVAANSVFPNIPQMTRSPLNYGDINQVLGTSLTTHLFLKGLNGSRHYYPHSFMHKHACVRLFTLIHSHASMHCLKKRTQNFTLAYV